MPIHTNLVESKEFRGPIINFLYNTDALKCSYTFLYLVKPTKIDRIKIKFKIKRIWEIQIIEK